MRVLFFNYEYPPLGGGAGNATFYILREFSKIPGLKLDLITSSPDEKFYAEKIGENIKIYRLPIGKNNKNSHFQSKKDLLVYSWRAYFFAKKMVRKNHYDLSHSFFSVPCGFLSLLLKWKWGIPYIVSLRGADVPGYSERFSFLYTILKFLIKLIWKKAEFTVSNSFGLKKLALKTSQKQPIEIICNGVDIHDFIPDVEKISKNKFIITLGATRITARKGIEYLILSVAELIKKHPDILVRIMGDGNDRKRLEEITVNLNLKNNIEFLGIIPREETHKYYQEAHLFVLPSLNEGMSNAMLEALASGLPIVTTDTGGAEELVDDGINGFIVEVKDTLDLKDKIEKIIENNDLRLLMGKNSREKALEMSWTAVAEKYYKLYEITEDKALKK